MRSSLSLSRALPAWISLLLAAFLLAGVAQAEVYMERDEALASAFPDAEVAKRILYFSDEERARVEELASAPMDSGLFTTYVARRDGAVVGYAFIDTRTVRSKAATFMVVLGPGGEVRSTRILAWQEPPEYQPPERWLAQFTGGRLDAGLEAGSDIHTMSGATLSTRVLTEGVRRVVAIHRIKLAED
jgi:Na+-translocating ferredoxin:NAD+ oxidoreductase RnfG subunit